MRKRERERVIARGGERERASEQETESTRERVRKTDRETDRPKAAVCHVYRV